MPHSDRTEQLIQGYLDDRNSDSEAQELALLICNDSESADAFAAATRLEALLETHFVEQAKVVEWIEKIPMPVNSRSLPHRHWMVIAATVLMAFGIGAWWWSRGSTRIVAADHRVMSGHVLVDGIESATIPIGSHVEVLGSIAAVIRLAEGSDVRLAPASSAVFRASTDGPVVELSYGSGNFRNHKGLKPIRVDTSAGEVSGQDAEFAVELQTTSRPGTAENSIPSLRSNLLAILTVAVLAGQVEVQDANEKVKIPAGESRAFSPEKKLIFAGRVVSVSADGTHVTLEGKPGKPGLPPQQREVQITEQTQLMYHGMPKGGDKPTIGYGAVAELDKNSPEKALALVFGDKEPHVAGMVKAVADNGQTITVEIYRKNEAKAVMPTKTPDSMSLAANTKPLKPNPIPIARRLSMRDPRPITLQIDREIDRCLADAGIIASPLADDAEFLRRASLDITGQIPTYATVRSFSENSDPDKRRKLIDELLTDPAYGKRFGAVWKRLIAPRPASNGKMQIDKVTPWFADQFNQNRGWNEVVYELLTTEADVTREPQAAFLVANSENFDPKPSLLTAATARLFLGVQLACAECHNHPFAEWKQTEFWSLAAFFSRVHRRSKADFSLTEETADAITTASITIPDGGKAAGTTVPARFLGGGEPTFDVSAPLRPTLAAWVTSGDNPYFARATVNRLWAHFFGRGLVEPLDGFQPGLFTASHPVVLDQLIAEFTAAGFDQQHLIRAICNTRAYGRTSRPLPENETDAELFSHTMVKVLSPDVLYDSLTIALNSNTTMRVVGKNGKVSQTAMLSIGPRDEFVNFFAGAAAEANANEYTHGIPQLLRLMNAEAVNSVSPLAKSLAQADVASDEKLTMLYLATLSRPPSDNERKIMSEYVSAREETERTYAGAIWILLNTSEFLLNH